MSFLTALTSAGKWAGQQLPLVGGMIQSAIDAKQQRKNVDRTIQANKELAQYAYNTNVEMWERQNAYNNPVSQMERLKNAGLNPNMVYGSGSAAGNTSSQLPKYNAPRVDYNYAPPLRIDTALGRYNDWRIKNAQIDLYKEQIRTKQAEADLKQQEAYNAPLYYKGRALGASYKGDMAGVEYVTRSGISGLYNSQGEYIGRKYMPQARFFDTQQQAQERRIQEIDASIRLKEKELEWYTFNRLAGPISQSLRLIPGIGSMFKGAKRSISAPRRLTDSQWKTAYGLPQNYGRYTQ